MGSLSIAPNSVAVADDRLVQVLGVTADGQVEVRDLVSGATSTCSAQALRTVDKVPDVGAIQSEQVTAEQWELALKRERAVLQILGSDAVAAQVTLIAGEFNVSRRTVFRWLAQYKDNPQTSALLPKPLGPPVGNKRINPQVEDVITSTIRDIYLTQTRAKKEEVVRMIQMRCAQAHLSKPSRKAVLARIGELPDAVVARSRLQPKEAASLLAYVPGTYHVQHPLDVVQIDHTLADVILVDEIHRQPIGRPWLTLAIDVATRVIVGFYVSLEAPSSTSVALCLTQAVLPKESWLAQRGLDCSWPVWGLPRALHSDNGADFTAAALRRGCAMHGIELILRPLARPHFGGHIERLIGTLMGRVHLLPGSTRSNPAEKGLYPAEKRSSLTLAELEQWLALEICEQYHHRPHRGLHRSPISAWNDAWRQHKHRARLLPEQPDQFAVGFLPFEQRKLRRDGLHLFNIRYWENVLPSMVKPNEPVVVRYDPRNLSKVWIAGSDGQYHPIRYANLSLPPITLWEHRSAVARLREDGDGSLSEASIFKAVIHQRELVEAASAKTKSARKLAQRQKNAAQATQDRRRSVNSEVDYSQPVIPNDGEIWDT